MREMTDPAGGFYSAEDADSVPPEHAGRLDAHKAEGAFYLWPAGGDRRALLGEDAEIVKRRFGIEPDGNAPMDPQQEFTGKNLLYVARGTDELAADTGKTAAEVLEVLNRSRLRLFQARVERPRPHLDDKVLTAWNGLMIAAFAAWPRVILALAGVDGTARGTSRICRPRGGPRHSSSGACGTRTRQRLLRRYRAGHAEIDSVRRGLRVSDLWPARGSCRLIPIPNWLAWAVTLQRRQDELFWDDVGGGWLSTTGRDPSVLLRMKED